MSTLSARQTILLLALFVVTSIGFLVLDNRQALDPLRNGVHALIVPVADLFDGIDDSNTNQTGTEQELAELQAKYDKLFSDYTQLLVNAQEVEQLRDLLKLQTDKPELTFVPARVLYRDPTNTQKFIIIDKGSADGIMKGMAVTDPNYYVGLVTEVDEHSARVVFAIDATQSVGAQLLNSNGVGIAWGAWQTGGRIELRHVDQGIDPEDGEWVVTACATEARTAQVPCGLPIGIVAGPARVNNQEDTKTIEILPAAKFEELKVVAVIIASTNDGA